MHASLRLGFIAALAIFATDSTADAQSNSTAFGPWSSANLPRVPRKPFKAPSDPDLQFIIRDGSSGWAFANCTTEGPGRPPARDATELQVGNGRTLVCTTIESPIYRIQTLMSEDGQLFCWKGVAAKYRTVSDSRLKASVARTSANGPWTLRATSSTPVTIKQVASFGGAMAWPLWLELAYETVDFQPARDSKCDGVFK